MDPNAPPQAKKVGKASNAAGNFKYRLLQMRLHSIQYRIASSLSVIITLSSFYVQSRTTVTHNGGSQVPCILTPHLSAMHSSGRAMFMTTAQRTFIQIFITSISTNLNPFTIPKTYLILSPPNQTAVTKDS